jgi:hypothetical protein
LLDSRPMSLTETAAPSSPTPPEPAEADFYRHAMEVLRDSGVPFLVGGAYAYARYTGVVRHTKDFDVFLRPEDVERALAGLKKAGYATELTFPHWLGKAYNGEDFVDLIYSSGNGIARVDERWFEHAVEEVVLGVPAKLVPAEEILWSKSFIMERERYDGADVAHLLLHRARELDWDRLLDRFGPHFRVLFNHLVLFGYIYPGERDAIPRPVWDGLLARLAAEGPVKPGEEKLCRGTILSRGQYLYDVEEKGYRDARLAPVGKMSAGDIALWSYAAREEEEKLNEFHKGGGEAHAAPEGG